MRNHATPVRLGWALIALVAAVGLLGCGTMKPAHRNSNDVVGERVYLRWMTMEQMRDYADLYELALGTALPDEPSDISPLVTIDYDLEDADEGAERSLLLAAQVGLGVVKFAFQFPADFREKEAIYRDEFGQRLATDEFYVRRDFRSGSSRNAQALFYQRYYGFELIRTTNRRPNDGEAAFRTVCGLAPSEGGELLRVAPLLVETNASRCKILTRSALMIGAGTVANEVATRMTLTLDGFWRIEPSFDDTGYRSARLGAIDWMLPAQSLDAPTALTAAEGLDTTMGLMALPPISFDPGGVPVGAGSAFLQVLVDERDPLMSRVSPEMRAARYGQ